MTTNKTYKGSRLDLQFYKGKSTINFIISVFNDDNTDFDLTIYDNIYFTIFHKKHGTVVLSANVNDGQGIIDLASPADNDVYIDLSHNQTNLRIKEYWYEVYGIREDSEEELVTFGIAEMI